MSPVWRAKTSIYCSWWVLRERIARCDAAHWSIQTSEGDVKQTPTSPGLASSDMDVENKYSRPCFLAWSVKTSSWRINCEEALISLLSSQHNVVTTCRSSYKIMAISLQNSPKMLRSSNFVWRGSPRRPDSDCVLHFIQAMLRDESQYHFLNNLTNKRPDWSMYIPRLASAPCVATVQSGKESSAQWFVSGWLWDSVNFNFLAFCMKLIFVKRDRLRFTWPVYEVR